MAEVLRFGSEISVEVESNVISVYEERSLIFSQEIKDLSDARLAGQKAADIVAPGCCGCTEEEIEDCIESAWRRARSWRYAGISSDGTMVVID